MVKTEAQKLATMKYNAKKFDDLLIRVPKGKKAILQAHAEGQGESLNGFVNRAIDTQMERDNTAKEVLPVGYTTLAKLKPIERVERIKSVAAHVGVSLDHIASILGVMPNQLIANVKSNRISGKKYMQIAAVVGAKLDEDSFAFVFPDGTRI